MSAIRYLFYAAVIITTLRQLVRLGLFFFSTVVLDVVFRIKKTVRKETKRGATVTKIGFLIGILFLAGGIFYFANTLTNIAEPNSTASPTPALSPFPSPMASPSPSPTIFPSPSPTATPTPTPTPTLTLSISAPSQVGMNTVLSISFIVNNPTGSTAHVAYIETNGLFADFSVQSSTHEIVANNVINIGNSPSGANVASVQLLSPSRVGTFSYTIVLRFQEMTVPIIQNLSIQVRGN